MIDTCAVYSPNSATDLTVLSCVSNPGGVANTRQITCQNGYWAKGPGQTQSSQSIILTGDATFEGCERMLNLADISYLF